MFSSLYKSRAALAAFLMSFCVAAVAAPGAPGQTYPMSLPLYKTLIVETVYPFSVSTYTPPVPVPANVARTQHGTPEQLVFQLIAAIQAGDFDWNMSLWSPSSRAEMQRRQVQSGQGRAYWEGFWKESRKQNYTLVSQIIHGRFVIIEYEFESVGGGKRQRDTIALEKQGEQWYLSQDLAANPLLQRWNVPGGRVQVAPESMFKK